MYKIRKEITGDDGAAAAAVRRSPPLRHPASLAALLLYSYRRRISCVSRAVAGWLAAFRPALGTSSCSGRWIDRPAAAEIYGWETACGRGAACLERNEMTTGEGRTFPWFTSTAAGTA